MENAENVKVVEKIIQREIPVERVIEKEIPIEKEVVREIQPQVSFEGKTQIIKALSQFNKKLENITKTANNPFTKSTYLDLATMLETIRPMLAEEGLFISQHLIDHPTDRSLKAMDTYLIHESGEVLRFPGTFGKPDNQTVQGVASYETYQRRYRIMNALGIVGKNDDNDGEGAMDRTNTQINKSTSSPKQTAPELPGLPGLPKGRI